jgi:hypothetical protein
MAERRALNVEETLETTTLPRRLFAVVRLDSVAELSTRTAAETRTRSVLNNAPARCAED